MRKHHAAVGGLDEEGVGQGARRVIGRRVERVEVEPLRLDLWTFRDAPAHRDEHVDDAVGQRRDRVPGTARRAVPRQRDVDRLLDQNPGIALREQRRLPLGKRGGNGRSGLTHPASGIGFGLWRQARRSRGSRARAATGRRRARAATLSAGRDPLRRRSRPAPRRETARPRRRAVGSPRRGRSCCSGRTRGDSPRCAGSPVSLEGERRRPCRTARSRKLAPPPGASRTATCPPCASTSPLTM